MPLPIAGWPFGSPAESDFIGRSLPEFESVGMRLPSRCLHRPEDTFYETVVDEPAPAGFVHHIGEVDY